MKNYRILFCTSEAYPLIKTGGLADVAGSLPRVLQHQGHDIRLVIPAYRDLMQRLMHPAHLQVELQVQEYRVRILQTTLPGSRVPVWLVDCPPLFDRDGNPYLDEHGEPWHDNARRFGLFNRVIALLAMNRCGMHWQPQVVHCNDWQTGLVPALLENEQNRPATVFSIHNLAYQGVFDHATFGDLQLPEHLWHYERLEYHDHFSFIKGGLAFADRVNAVSPRYAEEIQTPQFGCGMDGLLRHRRERLSGILNGINTQVWNPGTDVLLPHKYNRRKLANKGLNKQDLQSSFGLPLDRDVLLIGMVARLTEQKGIDLVLNILPELAELPVQLVVVGSGSDAFETALQAAALAYPDKLAVRFGFDEAAAHLVEGGADAFLMPSRFEPCGLNQMYSQRYGTLPIVTPVGGLSDTVVDASNANIATGLATGFVLNEVSEAGLLASIARALRMYSDQPAWKQLMHNAMQQDFSWKKSAVDYARLYSQALGGHAVPDETDITAAGLADPEPHRQATVNSLERSVGNVPNGDITAGAELVDLAELADQLRG